MAAGSTASPGRSAEETVEFTPGSGSASTYVPSAGELPRLRRGETVAGRFTVVRFVARGGMGEVYEAQDQVLRTHVALKTILPQFAADPGALERFRREVLLARKVSHPNVCRIYDLHSTETSTGEPLHFLTMEFLEGETLHQWLGHRTRMSPAEVLPVLKQVAAALDAAHAEGVVHRDFKPSNVMLVPREARDTQSAEMRAVVTDFGIARALRTDAGPAEKVTGTGLLGTPEYMAPEQVTGGEVGSAADIYALGLVLYEMLTGKTPFVGATPLETAVKRVNELPAPPKSAVPEIPERWNAAVLKCLEREPARRFSTAGAVEPFVERPVPMVRRRLVVSVAVAGLAAAVLTAGGAAWFGGFLGLRKDERWLRTEVIPEIHRLADSDKLMAAQLLAMKADAALPGNPTLHSVWRVFARPVTIKSEPPGARVYWREYDGAGPNWAYLGKTPVNTFYPRGVYRLRFELEGYRPYEAAANLGEFQDAFPLDRVGSIADNLVHIPGGHFGPGAREHELELGGYLIDRYEVTNRRYKAFVDAGGYQRPDYWRQPFLKEGRRVSWEKAVAQFTDRTGRPGPSTWELSSYPRGQDDYPVSGVSWYEAAAYAAFEGRDLPTYFHWNRAAGLASAGWIVPASNFADKGPARVGQYQGVSRFGASDMAGNVREWCFNEGIGRSGGRFILGGRWNAPTYAFTTPGNQSPWDRSPTDGFRLVTYLEASANLELAKQPVETFNAANRDYFKEKPVGEAEFRIYHRLYGYDPRALNPVVEQKEAGTDWSREKVSFDAAYGKERVIAYLFLPKVGSPPYQTVIYFPGSSARFLSSIDDDFATWDFIIRSGRALMYPIYRGTFERRGELRTGVPDASVAHRDAVIQRTQDLRRSIDYLETRDDVDRGKLGYFGYSWGGALGGLIPAVEQRLKAAALIGAGLPFVRPLPEVDPFNFLPRVKIPVLMLSGRYDEYYPVETSQLPMFQFLGTPPEQKRHIIYETGHLVPRDQLIKETLDWYDRYLGPVKDPRRARQMSR